MASWYAHLTPLASLCIGSPEPGPAKAAGEGECSDGEARRQRTRGAPQVATVQERLDGEGDREVRRTEGGERSAEPRLRLARPAGHSALPPRPGSKREEEERGRRRAGSAGGRLRHQESPAPQQHARDHQGGADLHCPLQGNPALQERDRSGEGSDAVEHLRDGVAGPRRARG